MFKKDDLVMTLDGLKYKFVELQPNKLCKILSMEDINKDKPFYQFKHNIKLYDNKIANELQKLTAQYESKESEIEDILEKRLDLFSRGK